MYMYLHILKTFSGVHTFPYFLFVAPIIFISQPQVKHKLEKRLLTYLVVFDTAENMSFLSTTWCPCLKPLCAELFVIMQKATSMHVFFRVCIYICTYIQYIYIHLTCRLHIINTEFISMEKITQNWRCLLSPAS